MLQAKYKCDWSAIHSGCTNRMGNACLISATAHGHAANAKAVIRAAGQIIMAHCRNARMKDLTRTPTDSSGSICPKEQPWPESPKANAT